jgi:hypothetical protein
MTFYLDGKVRLLRLDDFNEGLSRAEFEEKRIRISTRLTLADLA